MEVITIDDKDHKIIDDHIGYRLGFKSCLIQINSIEGDLLQQLQKYLSTAKGILVKFSIHSNQSLFPISNIMEKIHAIATNDIDIVFGVKTNDTISIGKCEFYILITGMSKI